MSAKFEQLVQDALAQDFSGWDFSWLNGRWHDQSPSWNYHQLVEEKAQHVESLLDMGTGGGEFLASLQNRPPQTAATESYPPNIIVAQQQLTPLGIDVFAFEDDQSLPLPDNTFQLIINRHESYAPSELYRILQPGGTFLTQQVGPKNCIEINKFLHAPLEPDVETWSLDQETQQLKDAGFDIIRAEEELLDSIFDDIGAIAFYLKIIEWQIPDFEINTYHDHLLALHEFIETNGSFNGIDHRFLIEARK